jgi:2,4-dienoyl-CoA reductase-like NADH-dependent reductase (Old Yellow Enzyme family)
MDQKISLNTVLKLKSGIVLKNRIIKSAMSENMSPTHDPEDAFACAYSEWAAGGMALNITGNVMVDRDHLGELHNVILDKNTTKIDLFKKWAIAGKRNNTALYMQINHPGKQTPKFLTPLPVAPSAIAFPSPMNKLFNKPRALSTNEIKDVIKMFATTAKLAKDAGFDGVQIHGAHGYLVSQFLSPKHNQRSDEWGGSIENRMRFLLDICSEIKKTVGDDFGVAVKLNSADFQKGGFTEEESMQVVSTLDKLELDFIEISGGTYEVSAMMGKRVKKRTNQKESTLKREAYFIEYARKISGSIKTPLMLTGGFREKSALESAVESGLVDLVGMGRPFAVYPNLANDLLENNEWSIDITPKKLGIRSLDAMVPLEISWYTQQIHRLGRGLETKPGKNVWISLFQTIGEMGLDSIRKVRS